MSLTPKDFSPSESLNRAIFKRKPSVFSAEDLNYSTGILKYAIDYLNKVLGPLKTSNNTIITLNTGPAYSSGAVSFNISMASETVIINGTPILLPAETVNFSRAVSTSASTSSRSFGVYLSGEFVQYVSSQKLAINEYEFFAGIAKDVNDGIASVVNNTVQGGNPVSQTLEGFDFVGYRNFSYEVLSDDDYSETDGAKRRLSKLATVVLETDGTVRFINNIDILPVETGSLNENYPVSVGTYVNRLRQFIEEHISTLQASTNSSIAALANVYATLSGPNILNGRNAKKIHETVSVNLTNDPIPVPTIPGIPGSNINSTTQLTDSTVLSNQSVRAYHDTPTDNLVLYLNNGDHFDITFSANKAFKISRIYCHPNFNTGSGGSRNEVTIKIHYPNGPITDLLPQFEFKPSIVYNKDFIDFGAVSKPNGTEFPLFLNSSRTCTIRGHFTSSSRFVVTSIDTPVDPEVLSLRQEMLGKQSSTPINYPVSNANPNSGVTVTGFIRYFPKMVMVGLKMVFQAGNSSTRIITMPAFLRPPETVVQLGDFKDGVSDVEPKRFTLNGVGETNAGQINVAKLDQGATVITSGTAYVNFTYPLN